MSYSNFIEFFMARVNESPDETVFTFLDYTKDKRTEIDLSLKDIYDNARAIAVYLASKGLKKGDRLIIFSTQTYDNVFSVYGSLFAGGVFILLPPPTDRNKTERFQKVLASSGAKFILCDGIIANLVKSTPAFKLLEGNCEFIDISSITSNTDDYKMNIFSPDDLAYLQYSSGSTSSPKGVMISHKNIMHNLLTVKELFKAVNIKTAVSWVPFFHNIGLVACLFFGIFNRFKFIIMSPVAFMERPVRWFEVIDEFKASITIGPNSSYALCAKAIKDEDLKNVDLSSLKYALNGSEAVSYQNLVSFLDKFKISGLKDFTFCPAYGLAETTMFASGSFQGIAVKNISYEEMERNLFTEVGSANKKSKQIVTIGKIFNDCKAVIVNPATCKECNENEIGEIWLQSDSVAQGYWNMPMETETTFKGVLENHSGYFLRTGDLGAISDGQLYLTGRCKELIVINGHNLYPQDIEQCIKENLKQLSLYPMAVFSTIINEKERVILGLEMNSAVFDKKELTASINEIILKNFNLTPYEIFFIAEGTMPRTDNGKIQLFKIKENYQNKINEQNNYIAKDTCGNESVSEEITDEIQLKIIDIFNQIFETNIAYSTSENFYNLGGDSLDTVHLVSLLESQFKIKLALNELVENPTIEGIANYIRLKKESHGKSVAADKLYLYSECLLPEDITPDSYSSKDISSPKNIFLTGSTGFLGAYLIKDLIQSTNCTIYCHVRASTVEKGFERIKENMKKYKIWEEPYTKNIIPVLGDLSKPLMGLTPSYFDELSNIIDSVYHNGALLNFIFPYNHLKKTNVNGTIECLRFACKNKSKYFNYISTFSVYDNPSHFKTVALEDSELASGEGFFLGYSETKWVSEKLVREAERRGLNISIYRPGDITGASTTGIWDMSDLVSRVINSCIQMKVIPDVGVSLYITPVDFVSQAISYLSTKNESVGKAFNLVNKNIASVKELHSIINSLGYPSKLISYKAWQNMLLSSDDTNVLKILQSLFNADETDETSVVRRYGDMEADFDISNTLKGLNGSNIACPELTLELILKYLHNFAEKGHIPYPCQL